MAVKYLDNAGTQYLVNKIKAIDGKIPTESQITTMITNALNTYKEGIVTIVESLPQTGEEGKLYLVLDPSDSDVYIIYTWEENAFKRMGSKTFTLTVDSALSSTSTNPVQNKVIKSALDGKANASHTHGSITNDGKLGTASRVVITGTDKKIGISTVTTTELEYLSGVTSAIQTQLNSKSATGHTHTAGDVAGLATVATTGSYNDLSDKPSINNATLTIQKNGTSVKTFTANASSNVTCNITVPTKTSDITNDSNFVDTSNSAVASGITSAKVTSYDTHIADTDIHVTTADKNKWNNQTYVFRYSSTALTPSSTNSNTLLDNTDNLKVGDKVIDSSGVLFSVTAIDTANSTFTIGTALIDLAQDSDVVHKSGDETVGGAKTFTDVITNNITNKANAYINLKNSSYDPKTNGQSNANSGSFSISFNTLTDDSFAYISAYGLPEYSMLRLTTTYFTDSENSITDSIEYKIYQNGDRSLRPRTNNNCMLGETGRRWSKIYGTEYYYGLNNVEFSTKFVTTDTNQTISGDKTFSGNNMIKTSSPKVLLINTSQTGNTPPSSNTASFLRFDGGTVNNFGGVQCEFLTTGENRLTNYVYDITRAKVNTIQQRASSTTAMTVFNADLLAPATDSVTALGSIYKRWSDCQTNMINGINPGALSFPDLSSGLDISGYITVVNGTNKESLYTPPTNGWICVRLSRTNGALGVLLIQGDLATSGKNIEVESGVTTADATMPVIGGVQVSINSALADNVVSAKFYPNLGNV